MIAGSGWNMGVFAALARLLAGAGRAAAVPGPAARGARAAPTLRELCAADLAEMAGPPPLRREPQARQPRCR